MSYIGRDGNIYDDDGTLIGPSGQAPNPATANNQGSGSTPATSGGSQQNPYDFAPTPTPAGPSPSPNDWQGLQTSIFGSMPSVSGATPPPFEYDPFQGAAPFSYDPYTPVTADQVLSGDPSYGFRRDQGLGALSNWAAHQGTYNTGGTAQDLIDYAGKSASQEFGNADARSRMTYDTNRNNAFGNYDENYRNNLNSYITNFGNALTKYNTNYGTQYLTPYNQLMQQYSQGVNNQGQLFNQQLATATA